MGSPTRTLQIALALALASACSESSKAAPKPDELGGGNNSNDNGSSNVTSEGGVAATPDAAIDYRTCRESAPRFTAKGDSPFGTGFSLLTDGLDVHVAYLTPTCFGVEGRGTAHGLRYLRLGSTGEAKEPIDIAYTDGESCVRMQEPTLSSVEGAIALAYSAAPEGAWAVFGRALDATQATRLDGQRKPTSIRAVHADDVAGASFTAWVEDDDKRQSTLWVAGTGGKPAERALIAADDGYHITAMALRGLPEARRSQVRAALVFASDSKSRGGVYLLALDADLKPTTNDVVRISDALPGDVSLDLQARGVLYTGGSAASPDLRFRALNETAEIEGDEVRITVGSEGASVGSLAPFTVGYAIAYRSVRADDPARAWVRLTLIDPQGNIAGSRNVIETSAAGGQVLIRAAVDGRLALGFREIGEDGSSALHVARVTCGS